MDSVQTDRLSMIIHYIDEWREKDPNLDDRKGFLEFIKSCDLGCFNVGDTKVWMNYHREARRKQVTIVELLFDKQKKIILKIVSLKRKERKPMEETVFVLSEEEKRELDEMGERLKKEDPLRRKQLDKK